MKSRAGADRDLLRYSLVFVCLATAFASVWEMDGQSARLLSDSAVSDRALQHVTIVGGALTDVILGLALHLRPSRPVFLLALGVMVAMTLLATLLAPWLWLHPLGPLTKNVPIAAVLWMLAREKT